MVSLVGLCGTGQRTSVFTMSSRKHCSQVISLQLRMFVCILSLSICVFVTKGLEISSGKNIKSMESSVTGSEKTSDQATDTGTMKDGERTGIHALNRTGSSQDVQTDEGQAKSLKEIYSSGRHDIFEEKSGLHLMAGDSTSKDPPSLEDDSSKTWEQLWNEQALSPSLPTSDLGSSIDIDDYYTYDYFGDAEDDEDEDAGGLSVGRSKKDTSTFTAESKSHSLDRLTELVTGANPEMGLVNLGTPNPDIEITIEVLNGDEVKHEDVVISMDLRDDVFGTPAVPSAQDEKEPMQAVSGTGGKVEDNHLVQPTTRTNDEDSEDVPGWSVSEDEDSYYFFEFAPLRLLPDPDTYNFEPDEPDEKGTWTDWSPCSASCGGGRSERSRSCGFSCTATESKDCNQQSCPRRDKSEARVDTPPLTSLDTQYLDTVLDPQNFDTDSCEEWMGCRSETLLSYLSRLQDLPNCPCFYPSNIQQNNAIWDRQKRKMFRWRDASGEDARLDVYKPTATYCIISLLSPHSTSLAAQQCCYDEDQRLITRGPGAGTPQLISAEISPELHYKIDVMPWIICKGDWTKYNKVRHPNNMWECRESPDQEEFYHLFQEAKNF